MNSEIEKQLSALRVAAEEEGELALHVALHMLHACYLDGTLKQFAKHCCAFSSVKVAVRPPDADPAPATPSRVQ